MHQLRSFKILVKSSILSLLFAMPLTVREWHGIECKVNTRSYAQAPFWISTWERGFNMPFCRPVRQHGRWVTGFTKQQIHHAPWSSFHSCCLREQGCLHLNSSQMLPESLQSLKQCQVDKHFKIWMWVCIIWRFVIKVGGTLASDELWI